MLHTLEILAFAAVYCGLLDWGVLGNLGGRCDESWTGLIYFSGINFATLGYTQIETTGPIRMINMMQRLGGCMVLTWSATFLYSICERAWRE
ncbi:MAG: ion channel [Woeseia sp.]